MESTLQRDVWYLPSMCGKFTQLASWNEVHTFSQPLTVGGQPDVVVSTPMRFANIMRFGANGERETVSMWWGFSGKVDGAELIVSPNQ